jgi:hypothetical protein
MSFRIAELAEQEPSEGVAALEARWAAVGVEHVCMRPVGQAMLCGVDSFNHVASDVAGRAGAVLAVAVPRIKRRGAVSQRGEPFLGVDHLVGVRRSARVLERETKAGIASVRAPSPRPAGSRGSRSSCVSSGMAHELSES